VSVDAADDPVQFDDVTGSESDTFPKPRAHGAAVMNHLDDVKIPAPVEVPNAERCTIGRCPTGASTSAIATSSRTSPSTTSKPTGCRQATTRSYSRRRGGRPVQAAVTTIGRTTSNT